MIGLQNITGRLHRKSLLIGFAVLLLAINVGRWGINNYSDRKEELAARQALLQQQHSVKGSLPGLKNTVAKLEKRYEQLAVYLFKGGSEEEISSSMQIILQEHVIKAGLEPEFIRPVKTGALAKGDAIGEIAIKVRLSGTMENFMKFLGFLYNSKNLFKIEDISLKPFKEDEMKIVMEIKGYYRAG